MIKSIICFRYEEDFPLYINLVRDPVELALSNFYYIREKEFSIELLTEKAKNHVSLCIVISLRIVISLCIV